MLDINTKDLVDMRVPQESSVVADKYSMTEIELRNLALHMAIGSNHGATSEEIVVAAKVFLAFMKTGGESAT